MAKQGEHISVTEAAKLMKISNTRVRAYITSGRLPAEKIGVAFILRRADVLAFKPMPRGRPASRKRSSR
jgi:excisionase family DNA binding protein